MDISRWIKVRCKLTVNYMQLRVTKNNIKTYRHRFDLENPKLTEILTVVNEIVRNTNVTGGILTHLPFLRYIIPGLTGFTALTQRYARMWQFIGVMQYPSISDVISIYR